MACTVPTPTTRPYYELHNLGAQRWPAAHKAGDRSNDRPPFRNARGTDRFKICQICSSVTQMYGGLLATVMGVHHAVAAMAAPRPSGQMGASTKRSTVPVRSHAWVAANTADAVVVVAAVPTSKEIVRAGAYGDGSEANGPTGLLRLGPSEGARSGTRAVEAPLTPVLRRMSGEGAKVVLRRTHAATTRGHAAVLRARDALIRPPCHSLRWLLHLFQLRVQVLLGLQRRRLL